MANLYQTLLGVALMAAAHGAFAQTQGAAGGAPSLPHSWLPYGASNEAIDESIDPFRTFRESKSAAKGEYLANTKAAKNDGEVRAAKDEYDSRLTAATQKFKEDKKIFVRTQWAFVHDMW